MAARLASLNGGTAHPAVAVAITDRDTSQYPFGAIADSARPEVPNADDGHAYRSARSARSGGARGRAGNVRWLQAFDGWQLAALARHVRAGPWSPRGMSPTRRTSRERESPASTSGSP